MALKSKEWFYKQCLRQVKEHSRLEYLSWNLLEKGIGQSDKTRGHVTQAIGAVQAFLEGFPSHWTAIQQADPTRSFDIAAHPEVLHDWIEWFGTKNGRYGRPSFGYNYSTLKGYLTPKLGGRRRGGGGGEDEFKKVLRLLPEFLTD